MQKRCNCCFEVYEENRISCPFCGYSETEKGKSSHVLQPGTLLKNERFIVGVQVGQGTVGIVYKAWDKRLHRVIAIKEFFPESLAARAEGMMAVMVYSSKDVNEYERRLSKFKREAMIMSLVTDSDNCIKAYDIFEENGTAYITMEYFDAPKLSEYLQSKDRQQLPEKEANAIMLQLLKGVDELHRKGIYHLDLSPDNIFIKKDDTQIEIKIFSFDSAVLKGDVRRGIETVRKVNSGFAAPELYDKVGTAGPWSDVYTIGAVYYYLLTGRVPQDAVKREKEDIILEPAQRVNVSDWVNAMVAQALAVVREQRYTDAGAFLEVLAYRMERDAKEQEVRKQKQKKHIRRLTTLVVSLFTVLAVAIILLFTLSKSESSIRVWVVADTDTAIERARYEAVINAFSEINPDVTVSLEVMSGSEMAERLQSAGEQDMPDLVETTYASGTMLDRCKSLHKVKKQWSSNWAIEGVNGVETISDKQIPLGFYAVVRYKQPELTVEQLQAGSAYEFIKGDAGYVDSDTTLYSLMQKNLPGRYEVVEADKKEIYLAEVFSVTAPTRKNENAAKKLLEFMMTDEAQEIIHITYNSDYLPITESMFELYVGNVFTELDFLSDTMQLYEIVR